MPFIGPDAEDSSRWRQIATVDLRQKPETKAGKIEFEVLAEFGYTTRPSAGEDGSGPFWRVDAVEYLVPRGMVTDLASVPGFLWGVVASYGRQTLPAILHDGLCYAAALPDQPASFRRAARREADALFLEALEQAGAGAVRRRLMWTGVRLGGRKAVFGLFGAELALVAGAALIAPWRWQLGVGAVAVASLLGVAMVAASRESKRNPAPPPGTPAVPDAPEYAADRFEPRALASLVGAAAIAAIAAPALLPVTLITLATDAIMRIGETPVPTGLGPAAEAPAGVVPEGVSARIAWAPLLTPGDSAVSSNPAPSDL